MISTLHAFALRHLVKGSIAKLVLPTPLRIADDWEESNLIFPEIQRVLESTKRNGVKESFKILAAGWQDLSADDSGWEQAAFDSQFVGAWRDSRRVFGYTLRDELVYQLKNSLTQHPEEALDSKIRYVIVDEYQDLNPCDLAVIRALAANGAEVLVCGDDDQSIYGFRKGDPAGIRRFHSDYFPSVDLSITECRRCDKVVLDASIKAIELDTNRIPKTLLPRVDANDGIVQILNFSSGGDEARNVARMCRELVDEGHSPGTILILLRSDFNQAFSRPLVSALADVELQSAIEGTVDSLTQSDEGRRVLAFLRLIVSPEDHLAWRTLLHYIAGIGQRTASRLFDQALHDGVGFAEIVSRPESVSPILNLHTLDKVRRAVDRYVQLLDHWRVQYESSKNDRIALLSLIREVSNTVLSNLSQAQLIFGAVKKAFEATKSADLSTLFLVLANLDEETDTVLAEGSVNILSMHRAKGLSADTVFIMGAEDEVLLRDHSQKSIAEGRRLLYVSMTRAKHRLIITYATKRDGQQGRTGRNSGRSSRTLTEFLVDLPLSVKSGADYQIPYR